MTKQQFNLQDAFLNVARKESIIVTIFLVNGFQIKGLVKGFDSYAVIIEERGEQKLVYKHAISTIAPSQPIRLKAEGQGGETGMTLEADSSAPGADPAAAPGNAPQGRTAAASRFHKPHILSER